MKTISRDAIQRMTGSGSGGVSVGGGGGVSIDLTGYATEMWTDENYVGKEFFSSLFKAYDANGTEVLPNDTTTTIDNIKAMFGFWTDFYISALGTGGQQSVGLRLAQLADVNVAGVQNDQVLKYDATSQKWVPGTVSGGSVAWSNITNTPTTISGYGITDCYISNGTITIGSNSITPITSHQSLGGYAKEQWVSQNFLALTGGEVTGTLVLSKTQDASGTADNGPALVVGGTRSQAHIEIDSNEIIAKSNASTPSELYLNSEGGSVFMNNIYVTGGNEINCSSNGGLYLQYRESQGLFLCIGGGNVGIGTNSPSHKLHVSGGIYASSYVSCLSDERQKDIVGEVELTVEQIATARTVMFTWKDKHDNTIHVGSIAQDWQKILPQAVFEKDGELSMDYSVIALMCGITIARKVEDHEERIRRIEDENKELRKLLNMN